MNQGGRRLQKPDKAESSTLEPPEGAGPARALILAQRDMGLTYGTVGWIVEATKQVVIGYNST